MGRRILVSGYCQTGGIAAALAALLPGDEVRAQPLPAAADAAALAAALDWADTWVPYMDYAAVAAAPAIAALLPGRRVQPMPQVSFPAFHPDICYLRDRRTGALLVPH